MLAPAGTPAPIVKRLETEMLRIVKMPDVEKQLLARQVTPVSMGSEDFGKFIASEIARWDAIRKAANIPQLDQY
jgi:tripartite-type tricarboxylate transporter receptor subunit TctC